MNKGPASFEPGSILAGKYRVERILGEGAMGVVLLAHHLHLDERVAIKVPLPHVLYSPEAVARFVREARAVVKIKSEYVAKVSDVGTLESGEPYIVMEYLEGQDLAALVERGGLPVEQAVEFVLQACEALAEAHSLGIVHRDLKPANLFCLRRSDGLLAVKVLDFGISKVTSAGAGFEPGMTKVGVVMGSPLYMSPEQMQSAREVDARSDIWAIGVILYELICGRPPFTADTLIALTLQISQSTPASMQSYRPDVPSGLEAVILRCLEKDRNHRYANVAELAQALREFGPKRARSSVERISRVIQAAGLSASALVLPPSSTPAVESDPTQTSTASSFGQTALPLEHRGRPLLIAGLGIVVLGIIGAVWFLSGPSSVFPHAATSNTVEPESPHPSAQPGAVESLLAPTTVPQPAVVQAPPPAPTPSTEANMQPSVKPSPPSLKLSAARPATQSVSSAKASAWGAAPVSPPLRKVSTETTDKTSKASASPPSASPENQTPSIRPTPAPSVSAKIPSLKDMIGDR